MHADPQIVKHVLALLRDWGWETGVEKLQAEIEATDDSDRRAALHLFVGWMAWERGAHAVALEQFKAVEHLSALVGWAGWAPAAASGTWEGVSGEAGVPAVGACVAAVASGDCPSGATGEEEGGRTATGGSCVPGSGATGSGGGKTTRQRGRHQRARAAAARGGGRKEAGRAIADATARHYAARPIRPTAKPNLSWANNLIWTACRRRCFRSGGRAGSSLIGHAHVSGASTHSRSHRALSSRASERCAPLRRPGSSRRIRSASARAETTRSRSAS